MTDPRNHYCEAAGCPDWGNFGFAAGKDRPLIWYCRDHKHLGDARLAPARTDPCPPEPVPVTYQQGRLL